jgi:hypothetical protein
MYFLLGATVADVDSIIPGGIGDSENYTVSGMVGIGTNKKLVTFDCT